MPKLEALQETEQAALSDITPKLTLVNIHPSLERLLKRMENMYTPPSLTKIVKKSVSPVAVPAKNSPASEWGTTDNISIRAENGNVKLYDITSQLEMWEQQEEQASGSECYSK